MPRTIVWILLSAVGGIVGSIAIVWACAWLYTRHNTQPAFYHPDEPGKITQIQTGRRNYNHPQLMLETALWVLQREHGITDPRLTDDTTVLLAGRRGTAYLMAGAALLCAWAGLAATRSWGGFVMGAVGAGLCPALLAHSKFLKEEGALIFGVAAVLCAGAILCSRRWHWAITLGLTFLLGAACGVAASGKYSGAVMLVPSIVLVLAVGIGRWAILPLLPVMLVVGAVWSWSGINHRAVADWDNFREGFIGEANHSQDEHLGLTMDKPNGFFADLVWTEAMPHVKVLALCAPLALLLQRNRRGDRWPPSFGWWLILCGGVYLVALSHSVIPFYRYALPVTMMLYLLAALAVVWIARAIDLPWQWRVPIVAVGAVVVIGLLAQRCADFDYQIANDSRDNLRRWANESLPPFTRVVADNYTELRGNGTYPPEYATRLRVVSPFFAADVGTLDDLRARNYFYVAIAGSNYERFLTPYTRPSGTRDPATGEWRPNPGDAAVFYGRQRFYARLMREGTVVWQQKAEHPMWSFINPDITVYRIGEAPPPRQRR